MTQRPYLSVVVPVYRAERQLARCLDSILSSQSAQVEVVVVDNHSPDRAGALADAYARRDNRVRAVHLPANVGPGRARNLGLAHARGAYLWFVDADDMLPPGSVPAVLARLAETQPDVLVLDHAEVFPDGQVVPGTPDGALARANATGPGPLAEHPQLLALAHSACTKIIRRRFLDQTGLRFHPGWYEDSAFNPPLLLAAGRIDALDRVCYLYRQQPGGTITKTVSVRHFDVFAQYERMWAEASAAGTAFDRFAPELFRLMINHLLVIAGSGHRVPRPLRRDFFRRMTGAYHRWRPPRGYPLPTGVPGLKHRLVRWHAYELYAALRLGWRASRRVRSGALPGVAPLTAPPGRRTRRSVPAAAAAQPADLSAR